MRKYRHRRRSTYHGHVDLRIRVLSGQSQAKKQEANHQGAHCRTALPRYLPPFVLWLSSPHGDKNNWKSPAAGKYQVPKCFWNLILCIKLFCSRCVSVTKEQVPFQELVSRPFSISDWRVRSASGHCLIETNNSLSGLESQLVFGSTGPLGNYSANLVKYYFFPLN